MRSRRMIVIGVIAVLMLGVGAALAVAPKAYQVTGAVVSATDDMIVVQKGKEKWELTRDASTKVMGDLAVGSKVTISYRMVATTVDVKAATSTMKAAKPAKAEPKAKMSATPATPAPKTEATAPATTK